MPKLKKAGNVTVSLDELSQEIDLKRYLGRKPTATEKRLFAELAVDTITNRTLDGQTVNGGKFKKYSEEYAESKGVTRDSVDLFLEGDMLESIGRRTSKEKASTVFIQMEKGIQTKKGYNHNVGDTLPKREFFGVTEAEARRIADQIKEEKEGKKLSVADLRAALALLDIEQTE
jgi:hypothetical protein